MKKYSIYVIDRNTWNKNYQMLVRNFVDILNIYKRVLNVMNND